MKIVSLLTTLTQGFDMVSMHGVKISLLELQADALGLPLEKVWISKGAPNSEYERRVGAALAKFRERGTKRVAFGDLFLEDIRKYRETFLSRIGMECVFPIWGKNTRTLANFFIDSGFRAIVCTVDPRSLGREYCGVEFDKHLLLRLPDGVDPCGENGEFHTFVYDGPVFKNRIAVGVGEIVERDGFYFADIFAS